MRSCSIPHSIRSKCVRSGHRRPNNDQARQPATNAPLRNKPDMSLVMQASSAGAKGLERRPGLSMRNFTCIAQGGFGDGHNSYAHSMTWFDNMLYVGTTRQNLCMLRLQSAFQTV